MSIHLMTRVYAKNVDAKVQRVLLVLADHANDDGRCWPSIGKIAWMLNLSERTIMRALKDLETQGAVRLTYGEIEILDPERLKRAAQGKL